MADKLPTVFECEVLHLRKIVHKRAGNITPIENGIHVPFDVKRIFYLYDIPGGESRAAHGHKNLQQFIVAASGSFDISLDDGVNKKTVMLNRPYLGIHIPPLIWCDISNFSSGAICLVLASDHYNEAGYIRDYAAFRRFRDL